MTETVPRTRAPRKTAAQKRAEVAALVGDSGNAELNAYKAKVLAEALRVKEGQGWCLEGLNRTLRELGLPEQAAPRPFQVDLPVTAVIRYYVDATSPEEAIRQAASMIRIDRARVVRESDYMDGALDGRLMATGLTEADVVVAVEGRTHVRQYA